MKYSHFFILTLLIFSGSQVWAENKKKEKVVYEEFTKLNFEEKQVDGKFLSPDGKDVKSERNLDFESLLDPKNSFSKELKRDAGAVR